MAQRRMFSKEITNSSDFLMMSQSAQNLYFHFGMNSDDDGFCEVFTIMRMTDSKPDDLQSLHSRGFIFVIDNKVCIVKDWHENNQIRLDRHKKSKYLDDPKYTEIYGMIMQDKIKDIELYKKVLGGGQPNGNQMVPQVRLGKDRIGKNSKDNISNKLDTAKAEISKDDIPISKDIKEKEKIPAKKEKERRTDIDELIKELKSVATEIDIVYDKTNDRNFAKHILDTVEFGSFATSLGKTRVEACISVMRASLNIGYWKGVCAGPMSIYQNYAEVYNQFKTNNTKKQNNQKVAFLPGISL